MFFPGFGTQLSPYYATAANYSSLSAVSAAQVAAAAAAAAAAQQSITQSSQPSTPGYGYDAVSKYPSYMSSPSTYPMSMYTSPAVDPKYSNEATKMAAAAGSYEAAKSYLDSSSKYLAEKYSSSLEKPSPSYLEKVAQDPKDAEMKSASPIPSGIPGLSSSTMSAYGSGLTGYYGSAGAASAFQPSAGGLGQSVPSSVGSLLQPSQVSSYTNTQYPSVGADYRRPLSVIF